MKKLLLSASVMLTAFCAAGQTQSIDILDGAWNWNYYSMLRSTQGWQSKKAYFEITNAATGDITINLSGAYVVNANYDAETGKITIPANQYIGHNDQYGMDLYLIHDRWNSSGDSRYETEEPFVASLEGANIYFDQKDCLGIGSRAKGYMIYCDEMSMNKTVYGSVEMPEEGWIFSHTGTFTDYWQTMSFDHDWAQPYEVRVEKNTEHPGLYRIVNPYGPGTPLYENQLTFDDDPTAYDINTDRTGEGYIFFSVEDPEFVTVYPTIYSGLTDSAIGKVQNYNLEGKYTSLYDYTKDQINDWGLLQLPASAYDAENGVVEFRNVYFGLESDQTGDYAWFQYHPTCTLTMTSGSGVSLTGEETASKEYYNLQGQRIKEPVRGELVISRCGGRTAKTIR